MRVLMIGMDPQLLDPRSETSKRMEFYRTALDELSVVVLESYSKPLFSKIAAFFAAWREARKLLKGDVYDLVSAQDPFVAGLIGYFLKLEFKVCLQLQIHTGLFTPYFWSESAKNRIYVRLAKFLLPRAECVKVVSRGIKDYLIKKLRIDDSKIMVLPVFTSFEKFEKGEIKTNLRKKYPQFDFMILMASRLVKQKNISLAIKAVGRVVEKHSKIGLVIVGSGPHEGNLKLMTKELGLDRSIKFEPWTDDLVSYYKTSDIFLLTSYYEGWARTALEAMASGLPVVMTDVGVAGEVVESWKNGVVVSVGDEVAVAEAIENLYLHPQKRETLGKEGKRTVENLYFRDPVEYLRLLKKSFSFCKKLQR